MSDVFNDAMKYKNPCKYIAPPEDSNYKPNVPTEAEFDLLRNAVKGMWDEMPILLAAWCGLREGEIFALKFNDIDFENGKIKVDENMAISDEGYKPKDPKSEKGFREVIADEYILQLLKQMKDAETSQRKLNKVNDKLYELEKKKRKKVDKLTNI